MVGANASWLWVIAGIATTAIAQIVLKLAGAAKSLSVNWVLYLGASLAAYSLSFVCYYLALRQHEISRIQPIMTVCVMIIIVTYGIVSGEQAGVRKLLGIAFGMVAIFLISAD
jgi:uncharacterized membrane protein